MSTDFILTLDRLQAAVAGAAAIRLRQALEPAGGPGSKVFPPTHEGGQYAWETRRVDGQDVRCVLLDSVQSQANRCELALLDALRDGRLRLPLIEARFAEFSDLRSVSTLEAPHRIADAIFRDSTLDGVPFRDSVIGKAFIESTIRDANGLFRWCPTALVFGMWDSTGSVGGLGTKFARALSAEIIGYGAQAGVHTSSRIDPLGRLGWGEEVHLCHFTPRSLRRLLAACGLRVVASGVDDVHLQRPLHTRLGLQLNRALHALCGVSFDRAMFAVCRRA